MSPSLGKLGLVAFCALAGAFAWNILFVQPVGRGGVADMRGRITPMQRSFKSISQSTRPSWKSLPGDKGEMTVSKSLGNQSSTPSKSPVGTKAMVLPTEDAATRKAVQRELRARGYAPGQESDGNGMITRAAIMAYEFDNGLAITGLATEELFKRILFGSEDNGLRGRSGGAVDVIGPKAKEIVVTLQHSLRSLGYRIQHANGVVDEETVSAVRDFEGDQSLPETGRVSGRLIARLARLVDSGRLALGK